MRNGPFKGGGSYKYTPVTMQRFTPEEKGSSLFGKKKPGRNRESSDQLSASQRTKRESFSLERTD